MTFADLPANEPVFLDANVLVYHFISHAQFGTACSDLIREIENGVREAFTSAAVMTETAHRLMTFDAANTFGWPSTGIMRRLKRNPAQIRRLSHFRDAVERTPKLRIQVLPVNQRLVEHAAEISQQHGLFTNDALIVAVMEDQRLIHLASNDGDLDRLPGIHRDAPV